MTYLKMVLNDIDNNLIIVNIDHKGWCSIPREDLLNIFSSMSFTIKGKYYNIYNSLYYIKKNMYADFSIYNNIENYALLQYVKVNKETEKDLLRFIEKHYIELLFENNLLKRENIDKLLKEKGVVK